MSARMQLFVIAVLVASSLAQIQTGNQQYGSYVSWSGYRMPEKMGVGALQKILLLLSSNKRNCPLGPTYEDCLKENISATDNRIKEAVELRVDPYKENYMPIASKPSLRYRPRRHREATLKQNPDIKLECECSDMKLDQIYPRPKLNCVCQEVSNIVFTGYSRYHYFKINPSLQKKPGFKRNKAFGKIID